MNHPMTDSDLITDLLERDSFTRSHIIMTECVRFIRSVHTGFLLALIVLDYVSARMGENHLTEFAGEYWIGKTRHAWMECSHLSDRRVRKALKTLQDHGLIEVTLLKLAAGKQIYVRVDPALIDRFLLAAAKTLALWESEEYINGQRYQ